jgi:hypothetical protein
MSGGYRPIFDLKAAWLSLLSSLQHRKYPTTDYIDKGGDFFTIECLTYDFLHIPIHRHLLIYLRFQGEMRIIGSKCFRRSSDVT